VSLNRFTDPMRDREVEPRVAMDHERDIEDAVHVHARNVAMPGKVHDFEWHGSPSGESGALGRLMGTGSEEEREQGPSNHAAHGASLRLIRSRS
jgi:hypothetical protein